MQEEKITKIPVRMALNKYYFLLPYEGEINLSSGTEVSAEALKNADVLQQKSIDDFRPAWKKSDEMFFEDYLQKVSKALTRFHGKGFSLEQLIDYLEEA